MTDPNPPVSIDLQQKCVAREIAMRKNVYRRRVAQDAMKQEDADREIATMEAVYQSLQLLKAPRPELGDTYPLVMHFATDRDRREFAELIKRERPGMVEAKTL